MDRTRTGGRDGDWAILLVAANMTWKVRDALGEAGLATYAPTETYRAAATGRIRTRPLIPGYLFADIRSDADLDLARGNHAVREVMHRDGRPVRAPALAIGAMVLLEAWHVFDRTWRPPVTRMCKRRYARSGLAEVRWSKGQRVKLLTGPFQGFAAEVLATAREGRIEVLLAAFGRATQIEVDEAALAAA
jgi:transcription antitermination factor NusG